MYTEFRKKRLESLIFLDDVVFGYENCHIFVTFIFSQTCERLTPEMNQHFLMSMSKKKFIKIQVCWTQFSIYIFFYFSLLFLIVEIIMLGL